MSICLEPLWSEVAHIFQDTQSVTGSAQIQTAKLHRVHAQALTNDSSKIFTQSFISCLTQIVTVKRNERCAEQVITFLKQYIELVSPPDSAPDHEAEPWFEFFEAIVEFFLKGFTARQAIVRYRCMTIVGAILPLIPLTDALLDSIKQASRDRCHDKDASVRVQAVVMLAMLDSDSSVAPADDILEPLVERLQHDHIAEVRRAAAFNIRHTKSSLTIVLDRVRDINVMNRRVMFTKILPSVPDFRHLSIATREKVLRSGLQDRDPNVSREAARLLTNVWLVQVDNNIAELLQRLDVISSPDVAELTLRAFFDARPDILQKFDFISESFWAETWPEQAVMLRCFIEYCKKKKFTELLETRIPDLADLADRLLELWHRSTSDQDEDVRSDLQFVVDEMLRVAAEYDYSDEEGRRKMVGALGEMLLAPNPPSDSTIANIVSVHRLLAVHDSDFLLRVCELVSDIQDRVTESETTETATVLANVLSCLSVIKAALERINSVNEHESYLDTLYSHIEASLSSPSHDIRTRATLCLNLICLASERYFDAQFDGFYSGVESMVSYDDEIDELGIGECELLMKCIIDMLLVHSRPDLVQKTAKLFGSLLISDNQQIRNAASYGLAKLLLAGIHSDKSSLQGVVVAYLRTGDDEQTGDQQLLQQQLNLFLRAYTLDPSKKILLAECSADIYESLFGNNGKSTKTRTKTKNRSLTPAKLMTLLVDLTAPLESTDECFPHSLLAKHILQMVSQEQDKFTQRVLASWLPKLQLAPEPSSRELFEECNQRLTEILQLNYITASAVVYLNKFAGTVQKLLNGEIEFAREPGELGEVGDEPGQSPLDADDEPRDEVLRGLDEPMDSLEDNEVRNRASAGSSAEIISGESFSDITAQPMETAADISMSDVSIDITI